jgi:dipeptidyl aminopeptidase/acylaminoacyl peptidase
VLLVHGGPAARDHWVFDPEVQWLANRGYAVLQVNYRGSTGVGRKCHAAGKDNLSGNRVHEDLADAVKWAVQNASVDPRRVAVIGASFGGYAALAGAAFSPDTYAAAASYFGVSGLIEMRRECLPRHLSLLDIRRLVTHSKWKRMYRYSPLLAADKIKAPLMIAHGANDPRVNPAQSRMMVDAVRNAGGCVEYVVYQGEGHGLVRLANRLDFHRRMEVFLGRHLCGRVEPGSEQTGSTAEVR